MSQAEGYELFMCPECEYNIYEPGPACPRCGYSVRGWFTPRTAAPQPRAPSSPNLLQAARRDNSRTAARPTMLLIHSMPAPKGRTYKRWAGSIHTLLSRIAQHPFTLTPETQTPLRHLYDLLEQRKSNEDALEALFTHCNTLLEAIKTQRPPPIGTPRPAPTRHKNKRHRPPQPHHATPSRALPAEYTLSPPERRTLKNLEKALQTLASFTSTGQRYSEPDGSLLAKLPLPTAQDPQETRARIDQRLAGQVTWVTTWRTDNAHGHQRTFTINNTNYTLILDYTDRHAYYIELTEPTNRWA